jgi:hypothetical protein
MTPFFQPDTFAGAAQLLVTFFTVVAVLVNCMLFGRT